jgi:hypothetical protein
MSKYIQATLTLLSSIAITILITAAVVPAHARGDGDERTTVPGIRHAVMVEHTGSPTGDLSAAQICPAVAHIETGSSCPYLAGLASKYGGTPHGSGDPKATASSQCPYLASRAANAGCPAISAGAESSACPALAGKLGREAGLPEVDDTDMPRGLSL